jgi:hypothetical protein
MSWWIVITTEGRLLTDVSVTFVHGELRVSWVRLGPGEDAAILIDRLRNVAYLSRGFQECQILAQQHQYELVFPKHDDETFLSNIERFLSLLPHKTDS